MSIPACSSNNSPPSQPEQKKEKQELHEYAMPAEERGVKRNSPRERGGEERKLKKLKRRNYTATFEENIELARAWLEKGRNSTPTVEHNVESVGALLEMYDQLDEYGIHLNQYNRLSEECLVAKIKEDYAAVKRAKEDPTDELWAAPDEIRAEIAVWKREAGLPDKFMGIHDCQGRCVDRPDVGCDFAVFVEDIYVCKATGIVHVCVGRPCSRATVVAGGDVVCTISASNFPYLDDKLTPALALQLEDEERDRRWEEEEERRWEEEEEREWQREDDDDDNVNPSGAQAESDNSTEAKDEKGEEEDWLSLEQEIFGVIPSGAEADTDDCTGGNEQA